MRALLLFCIFICVSGLSNCPEKPDLSQQVATKQTQDTDKSRSPDSTGEAKALMADATRKSDGKAKPCTDCGVADAGHDNHPACPLLSQEKNPNSMTIEELTAFVNWRQLATKNPTYCHWTCPVDSAIKEACADLKGCNQDCNTSQLVGRGCHRKGRHYDKACAARCSPFTDYLSIEQRTKLVKKKLDQISAEIFSSDEWKGAAQLKARRKNFSNYFLCLNLMSENTNLEPIERNNEGCASTAFGLGQVLSGTFFANLGLSRAALNRCGDLPIREIPAKCESYNSNFYRGELLKSYGAKSARQLFDMRSFDLDLQLRTMVGAWLNHFRATGDSWAAAWNSYYGGVNTAYVNKKVEACVKRQPK